MRLVVNNKVFTNVNEKPVIKTKTELTGMHPVDEKLVKHLKDKQYFEIDDITSIFKDAWCFFIKGKKGIGKSYSLKKIFDEIANDKNAKFAYIRTRDSDIKECKGSWINDKSNPFYIKSGNIFTKDKNEFKGIVGNANNLSSKRSQNYIDFKYIIYDEFVEPIQSNYKNRTVFARNFMTFVMDINRDMRDKGVTPIKVFCFGNNNMDYDPFFEYFQVDVLDTYFCYDKDNGILCANLRDYYNGVIKDSKSYGLAYYDNKLHEFLTSNISGGNLEQMINYSKVDNGIIENYYYWDKTFLAFVRLKENQNQIAIRIVDKPIKELPKWCFREMDWIERKDLVLLNDMQAIPLVQSLTNNIKFGNFKFASLNAKEKILEIINYYKGYSVVDLMK